MPAVIGDKAMAALGAIRDALGLDYAGIDFGLSADGNVLLFEANATMVIAAPDPDERWAYRRIAIARIIDAVVAMIRERAGARPRHRSVSGSAERSSFLALPRHSSAPMLRSNNFPKINSLRAWP